VPPLMESPKNVTKTEFLEIFSRCYAVGEIWFYWGSLLGTQNSPSTPKKITPPQSSRHRTAINTYALLPLRWFG